MSINHNRIKVADLETNEPNKTLITNANGELEFSDITGGGSQTLQQTLTEGNLASLPIVLSSGDSSAKLYVNSPLGTTSVGASNIDLIKNGGGQVTINANGTIQWVGATNALFTLPSKPNGYTGELATLDDIPGANDFVSKTGEVLESIDGNKTFIDTVTFRQSEETRMNIDGNVLKFITNDNSSSLTISPVELSAHRTQLLPDKDGTFAMLEDISGGSQDLQQVVDTGNEVVTNLFAKITDPSNSFKLDITPYGITQTNINDASQFIFDSFNKRIVATNTYGSSISSASVLSFGMLDGEMPNFTMPLKPTGNYTLATLDDISVGGSYALQDIINNGSNITEGNTITNTVTGGSSSFSPFDFSVFNDSEGFAILRHKTLSFGDNSGNVGVLHGDNSNGQYHLPNKTNGSYTLATLDDLTTISDNFVHKTGEVSEVIDGYKTFRFPITFRGDASAAYTTVDSTEIKFTVDVNDNSSVRIRPKRENFDEDENFTQELQAKDGVIALLNDFKTINGVSVVGTGNIVTSTIASGTPNTLSKYNSAGNNLVNSNIIDNGSTVVINKPTEINSGIANTSGLKFTNLKTNSNWVSEWVGTIEDSSRNITLDSFGNMYVQSDNSKNIIKITPEGVSSVFITLPSYPYGIISDSSNNVYVTTNAGNVTKITPAGVPTILGTTGTNPRGLVFDSTGNIYVANYSSNNVSKITPAGVSTILGTTGTNPNNIVIDSLGNLYTVNFTSRNVSKITSAGVSTILGTTGSDPVDIAIDSIGNAYVTNTGAGNVSKITPAGVSTIFSSLPSGLPFGIVVDAMDNVLYSDWDNGLVKITPGGISTVLSPSSSFDNPIDIVLDAIGNVYVCNRGRRTPKLTKITAPEAPKLLAVNSNGEVILSKIIGNVAPTSATATGTVGEIRVAAGYIYWCTAPNTWIRAAGSTF